VQFSLGQVGTNYGYNILFTGCIEAASFFSSGKQLLTQVFSSQKCLEN